MKKNTLDKKNKKYIVNLGKENLEQLTRRSKFICLKKKTVCGGKKLLTIHVRCL